jgi:HPr kinase/phosphorylase
MTDAQTLHASCVVVGEAGILIRGPAGSGKSLLARDLILDAERLGRFARLVSDDRVRISNGNGRVLATAVPPIAGKLEARGFGLLTMPYENSAIVRMVIDCLSEHPPRLPAASNEAISLCGVSLPRIGTRSEPGVSRIILWRLDHPGDVLMTNR